MKALQLWSKAYSAPKPTSQPTAVLSELTENAVGPKPAGTLKVWSVCSHAAPPLTYTRVRSATTPPRRPETVPSQLLFAVQESTVVRHGVVPFTSSPAISPSTPKTAQPDWKL